MIRIGVACLLLAGGMAPALAQLTPPPERPSASSETLAFLKQRDAYLMAAALELGEPFSEGELKRIEQRLGLLPTLAPDLIAGTYRVRAKHMPTNEEFRDLTLNFTRRPDGDYDVYREVRKEGVLIDARAGLAKVLDPQRRTHPERADMVRVLDVKFETTPAYADSILYRTRKEARQGEEQPLILSGRYTVSPWGKLSVRLYAKAISRPVRGEGWREGGPLGTFNINPVKAWKARTVYTLVGDVEEGVAQLAENDPARLAELRAAVIQRLVDAGKLPAEEESVASAPAPEADTETVISDAPAQQGIQDALEEED